jgi:nucleoside-diphosphate-sugar epimerase
VCPYLEFNIFGPGQGYKFLIPKIIIDALDISKTAIEVNSLEPKRDYVYVDDLVLAIVNTIDRTDKFSIFNIGSGTSYSVKEIIDIVQSIAKTNKQVLSRNTVRKNEVIDIYADISKARQELGFSPLFSLEAGIRKMIEYLKEIHKEH